jgi:hypothetical protein
MMLTASLEGLKLLCPSSVFPIAIALPLPNGLIILSMAMLHNNDFVVAMPENANRASITGSSQLCSEENSRIIS